MKKRTWLQIQWNATGDRVPPLWVESFFKKCFCHFRNYTILDRTSIPPFEYFDPSQWKLVFSLLCYKTWVGHYLDWLSFLFFHLKILGVSKIGQHEYGCVRGRYYFVDPLYYCEREIYSCMSKRLRVTVSVLTPLNVTWKHWYMLCTKICNYLLIHYHRTL